MARGACQEAHAVTRRSPGPSTRLQAHTTAELVRPEPPEEAPWIRSAALAFSASAVAIADLEGNLTYANKSFLRLWRFDDVGEVLGRPAVTLWQAPDRAAEAIGALGREGGWIGELVARRKDGSQFDAQISASLVRDGSGAAVRMIASFVDITSQKRAREALRQSEAELAIRNRIASIFLTTPDDEMYGEALQVVLSAMESKLGVFGYVDDDGALACPSMTTHVWDRCQVPNKDIVFPREMWGGVWGRALMEKRSVRRNGRHRVPKGHVPIRRSLATPLVHHGELIGLLHVANKSTVYDKEDERLLEIIAGSIAPILDARLRRDRQERERKRAEEALRESESKYRHLFENVQDVYFRTGLDSVLIDVSPSIEKYGFHPDELIGTQILGVYENPEERSALVERLLEQGEIGDYELRLKTPHGRVIDVSVNARLARGPRGEPVALEGTLRDITWRKRAEEALRESEAKYRALIQSSIDAIAVAQGLEMRFVNQALLRTFGYESEAELLGKPFTNFLTQDHRELVVEGMRARKMGPVVPYRYEQTGLRKDGTEFPIEVSVGVITYEGRPAYQVVIRDITDRKQAEAALQKAREELESKVERQIRRGDTYDLTFRELTVLHLVAAGKSDKEIGIELGISPLTVHKHLTNIFTKMGVSCRTEACVRALRAGLLD